MDLVMKTVALTFEHNHSTYSDLWRDYYGKNVDDLKIVNANNGLMNDWGYTANLINELQPELFSSYDVIVIADIDELLVPDPEKYQDLREFIEKNDSDVVRAVGYNVMEVEGDKPLDLNRPILEQRRYWSPDEMYNKFVILRKQQNFIDNHKISGGCNPNPELVLMHLRDADLTSARERLESLGRELNEEDLKYRLSIKQEIPEKWSVSSIG